MEEQIKKTRNKITSLQQTYEMKDYGDERLLIKDLIAIVTQQQTIIEKLVSGTK